MKPVIIFGEEKIIYGAGEDLESALNFIKSWSNVDLKKEDLIFDYPERFKINYDSEIFYTECTDLLYSEIGINGSAFWNYNKKGKADLIKYEVKNARL